LSGPATTPCAPLRHRHRHDLLGEQPVLDRRRGPLVRAGGELVLLLAGYREPGVVPLGGLAHRKVVEGIGEAIEGHRVDQLS